MSNTTWWESLTEEERGAYKFTPKEIAETFLEMPSREKAIELLKEIVESKEPGGKDFPKFKDFRKEVLRIVEESD